MRYVEKYDRYVDEDLMVYRYTKSGKFVQCKPCISKTGYWVIHTKLGTTKLHRLVWESFNGEIPNGMEIDHINRNTLDYSLSNLRCVTHKENMNNKLTKENFSKIRNGKVAPNKDKPNSEFGKKFKEYCEQNNIVLNYSTEHSWFVRHGEKCRWEV